MRSVQVLAALVATSLLGAGCAHRPPEELVDARRAVQAASAGPAAELAPTDLARAEEALQAAETAYQESPRSWKAADLAYIAQRRAELAAVLAAVARSGDGAAGPGPDPSSRLEPEPAALGREEERGYVIPLASDQLFSGADAEIAPAAHARLEGVAGELLTRRARAFAVEGRGADADLARRRAQAVKAWLASHGYPEAAIEVRVVPAAGAADAVEIVVPRQVVSQAR